MTKETQEKIETVKTELASGTTLQKALKTANLSAATWYNSKKTGSKKTKAAKRTSPKNGAITRKPIFLVHHTDNATYLIPTHNDCNEFYKELSQLNQQQAAIPWKDYGYDHG